MLVSSTGAGAGRFILAAIPGHLHEDLVLQAARSDGIAT
jgi:hypothetical protein